MTTNALARTLDAIDEGMARSLHIGAQLYVSLDRQIVADLALGESRPGVPMTTQTLVPWLSCTKPIVAIAIARLWERGLLDIDDPVVKHIPEFAANGKHAVTLRHVLTHTGGFRKLAAELSEMSWPQIIAAICDMRLETGWMPGQRAGYHTQTSWYILGELIQRLDGRSAEDFVRREIFQKLDMPDCWLALPPEQFDAYADRMGTLVKTGGGRIVAEDPRDERRAFAGCAPASSARGPMRQLARFYEMLSSRGQLDEARIISPQTAEAMTARHRAGMYDQTFKFICDWGLGFKLDAKLHGKTFEPYGYGAHASHRTFGHGGAESSVSFADPENKLVVCLFLNGAPGDRAHQKRMHEILTLLYEDLSLAPAAA